MRGIFPCVSLYSVVGEFVGGDADPIPDHNLGNRMLQSMGWSPGMGLGTDGSGILSPIIAFRRSGRKGFGSTSASATSPHQGPSFPGT